MFKKKILKPYKEKNQINISKYKISNAFCKPKIYKIKSNYPVQMPWSLIVVSSSPVQGWVFTWNIKVAHDLSILRIT